MKLNLITPFIFLFFLFLNINITYAITPDSTGVKTENGKTYIIHLVEAKEGWMGIARRYNVPMEQLMLANPGVEGLKIGQFIHVPVLTSGTIQFHEDKQVKAPEEIKEASIERDVEMPSIKDKYKTPLIHKVTTGETLFSLSKKFNVKIEDIRNWNNMDSNNLQLGEELIVGYVFRYNNGKNPNVEAVEINTDDLYASAGEMKKTRKELRKEKREAKNLEENEDNTMVSTEMNIAEMKVPESKATIIEKATPVSGTVISTPETGKRAVPITEKGSASWIDDNDINPSKFYALHRTAPVGTIIKVTNRMNNKTVFVKVVGVLPNTGDNSNITIKLSKAAAIKLDVIDARFQAELHYNLYE
jgi:LysM repeat protein